MWVFFSKTLYKTLFLQKKIVFRNVYKYMLADTLTIQEVRAIAGYKTNNPNIIDDKWYIKADIVQE